jgi:preprotein translocase subunit SecE
MASPAQFVREVKQEASRVTWPKRKEVGMMAVMVLIIVSLFVLFFAAVDLGVSSAISWLLGVK